MYMLQFGQEPVPKRISVRGAGEQVLWEPIIGAVIETSKGWVLLETGIGRRALNDAAALDVLYPGNDKPWGLPGDPLTVSLEQVGLKLSDLHLAATSHLHCDHSGGVSQLASASVPIAIQHDELEFALKRSRLEDGYYKPDFVAPGVTWQELDGDAELAPGVWAVTTPGHAAGHMSYRVDLPNSGTWLLAVDAGDLAENFTEKLAPGQTVQPDGLPRAEASLQRLLDLATQLHGRLIPGHDQLFWDAVRHPAGGHR